MPFKEYINPLYENVPDSDWTSGLCCIFANSLQERFNIPLRAILVKSVDSGLVTLVHAFGSLHDGRIVDALGIRHENTLLAHDYKEFSERTWRDLHGDDEGEPIMVVIEDVTLPQLWALNPEDLDATNAAHVYIQAHPELFGELEVINLGMTI